jgi:CHAT domain-containing protein
MQAGTDARGVEAKLEGVTEVLIIPHKELFEVPWAAPFDSKTGQCLIQRCVLRLAPSLRVARTAADALRGIKGYSLAPPPRSVNGRMLVSQPTYVEKPKYMTAGCFLHSQRRY